MSNFIPFGIQAEIMKRLPVKSLLRFRSVSKPWKSMINSSYFIKNYHVNNNQLRHHLLVRYNEPEDDYRKIKYVSIVDDDTFPENQFSMADTIPTELLEIPALVDTNPIFPGELDTSIVGTSQGLFCFYRFYRFIGNNVYGKALIWNPSIRKSVVIPVPNVLDFPYHTLIGFGVTSQTTDPKIVKISYILTDHGDSVNNNLRITFLPWQAEVFTLSSGIWRSPTKTLPRKSITFGTNPSSVCKDEFIYWLACDWVIVDNVHQSNYLIMSFDMVSEEFTEVYLPHSLSRAADNTTLTMSMLKESLVVFEENFGEVVGVWMMEDGVTKSFTKIFRINTPELSSGMVLGFRKSGEAIIIMMNGFEDQTFLLYEPISQQIINIEKLPKDCEKYASSYVETLLLLDY